MCADWHKLWKLEVPGQIVAQRFIWYEVLKPFLSRQLSERLFVVLACAPKRDQRCHPERMLLEWDIQPQAPRTPELLLARDAAAFVFLK